MALDTTDRTATAIEARDREIERLRAALEYIRDNIGPGHGEPRGAEYADQILDS